MPPLNILWKLIVLFVPLSLLSLGGGASILAPIHHQTVEIEHWLTQQEFVDLFAISRAAPGPSSMLVILIGFKMAGWTGALVSLIANYAPSCTLAYGVSHIWNRYRGTKIHSALERGLVPIGTGLIIAGSISVLRAADTGIIGYAIALVCGSIMTWRSVHPMILLAAGSAVYTLLMLTTGQIPA
jgi:chromate transporter